MSKKERGRTEGGDKQERKNGEGDWSCQEGGDWRRVGARLELEWVMYDWRRTGWDGALWRRDEEMGRTGL